MGALSSGRRGFGALLLLAAPAGVSLAGISPAGIFPAGISPAWAAAHSWRDVALTRTSYGRETQDFGVAPTSAIRTAPYDVPTPLVIAGASTVTTPALRQMMLAPQPPLLIDVVGGAPRTTVPGALWWPGAGVGTSLHDAVQKRFAAAMARVSRGDKARVVVFFCLSRLCWLSHNAAVRAVALGYRHVDWYRGGWQAWHAARLGLAPIPAPSW